MANFYDAASFEDPEGLPEHVAGWPLGARPAHVRPGACCRRPTVATVPSPRVAERHHAKELCVLQGLRLRLFLCLPNCSPGINPLVGQALDRTLLGSIPIADHPLVGPPNHMVARPGRTMQRQI